MQLAEVIGQGHVAELVHHKPDGDGQAALVNLVRLIVEGLKSAGVGHTHQVVKRPIVIGDHGEHGLFSVAHHIQLHIVPAGNAHDLRQDERGQPDGGGN